MVKSLKQLANVLEFLANLIVNLLSVKTGRWTNSFKGVVVTLISVPVGFFATP